jgi:hypothetical protein
MEDDREKEKNEGQNLCNACKNKDRKGVRERTCSLE